MMSTKCIYIYFFLLNIISVHAIEHYIRADADEGGDGSDWTNAWNTIPENLVRGDTYYIADGFYGPYNFDDPVLGNSFIWIKKATVNEHGTNIGWQDNYGNGVAEFTSSISSLSSVITFSTSNWIFNGIVGYDTVGHGFKISYSNENGNQVKLLKLTNHPINILISHIEMEHAGNNNDNGHDCFYTLGCDDVSIKYCWIHDMGRVPFLFRNSTNVIIDHCWISRNDDTAAEHSTGISAYNNGSGPVNNFTISFNVWQDIEGTGVITHTDTNWAIYGNVIYWDSYINDIDREIGGNGVIGTWTGYYCDSAKVYNNTIVNIRGGGVVHNGGIGYSFGLSHRGHEVYNNLWFNCNNVSLNAVKHDYNYFYNSGNHSEDNIQYGSANIFIDYDSNNFHLRNATAQGKVIMDYPMNIDKYGIIRGKDGIWDRGAFEFDDEHVNFPPDISRNLRIKNE